MPTSGEVQVWASDLNAGSYDNCTCLLYTSIGQIRQIQERLKSAQSADRSFFSMKTTKLIPEVNALLVDLLAQMRAILGDDLIGLYLDGSLALGDFDPATSDVDFIAAIARPLSAAQFDALAAMHRQMRDSGRPFATELEGSYIPRPALRRHDPADATFANLERGSDEVLKYKTHHSDCLLYTSCSVSASIT